MSRKKEQTAALTAVEEENTAFAESEAVASFVAAETPSAGGKTGVLVWCGPTVRGAARHFTVFSGGIPTPLAAVLAAHPAARALLVRAEDFARVRRALENSGSAETLIFRKIKSEL